MFKKLLLVLFSCAALFSTMQATEKTETKSKLLKEHFPTGVFWSWERTARNAQIAGLELWDFVGKTFEQLKANGYNTVWFVNVHKKDIQLKILEVAKDKEIHVLMNSDFINAFNNKTLSVEHFQSRATSSAEKFANQDSLLGYVLKDEPLIPDLENCSSAYEIMKDVDPTRDSIAVVMNSQTLSFLRDSSLPVVCTDIYYFGYNGSVNLPNPATTSQKAYTHSLHRMGKAAERYNKHSWVMPQTFTEPRGVNYRANVDGEDCIIYQKGSMLHWRMPTVAETKWQIYEALRNGTKGVLFFIVLPGQQLTDTSDKLTKPSDIAFSQKLERMANNAANSWKGQKPIKEDKKVSPYQALLDVGGKSTPQFEATKEAMTAIRNNEQLLLECKFSRLPLFYADDEQTDVETFTSGKQYVGVIVNRDLNQKRTAKVLVPATVTAVKDLVRNRTISLTPSSTGLKEFEYELEAGDGTILVAETDGLAGLKLCNENFAHQSVHRVVVNNKVGEVVKYGSYRVNDSRCLKLKEDY